MISISAFGIADAIGLALTSGNAWSSFEPTMMRTGTLTSARLAFVMTVPSIGAIANAALIRASRNDSCVCLIASLTRSSWSRSRWTSAIEKEASGGQVVVWLYGLVGRKAITK